MMISTTDATITVLPSKIQGKYVVYLRFHNGKTFTRGFETVREAEEIACSTALSHASVKEILDNGDWLSL